jgi:putative FmdB family regulatory protein
VPTYSYRCTECDNAFDIQQALSEDSLTVCPACNGKLRKIFAMVGVTFNGSGFYQTDSRAAAGSTGKPGKAGKASSSSSSNSTGSNSSGSGSGSSGSGSSSSAPSTSSSESSSSS